MRPTWKWITGMFRIGEFSTFSRVSVKMLRHYDELGLLKPARVDPFSNYRYYSADQLPRLNRILALKDLGFSLEQVKSMLDDDLSTEQMRGMLKLRRAEIWQQLSTEESRLSQVEARLAQIDQAENKMPYDVVLRAVEAQTVAAIRQTLIGDAPTITQLFEELEAYVGHYGARAPRPPLMLYHDTEYDEQAQDIEVVVPIRGAVPGNGRVTTRELKGHETMACLIHTGAYGTLQLAFGALLSWIEANQYRIVGPTRELFLRFGASQEGYELPEAYLAHSAAEFVTELQIPVKKTS
jgi:DNA-binding transcriptional MerR regulator